MNLKCKAYTWDKTLAGSDGVYSVSEWSTTRRAQELADTYRDSTDENYKKTIQSRPDKVLLTNAICKTLDFGSVKSVGEIGGVPYMQARQIVEKYPSLKYLATDQDAASNDVLARVPMLSKLNIQTFDAKQGDLSLFDDCDWIITFAVDYALDDEDIMRLLGYLRDKRKTWLLFSVSIAGLPRYLRLRAGFLQRALIGRPQRFHGWERSIGWFSSACDSFGLHLEDRGKIGGYRLLWISP